MCKISDCNNKNKYGEYCYKHRRDYLVNEEDSKINIERWTNKCSDYLKKDILSTLHSYNIKCDSKLDKKILFKKLTDKINTLKKYDKNDIKKIIKIQKLVKEKKKNGCDYLRGEGFLNKTKTNNDTDFFTYETRDEIEDKYYFSYTDEKGFIWFFDIRSFNKLIELKQPNPYTMSKIPDDTILRAKKLNSLLKLTKKDEVINQEILQVSRKQMIKQKCIDIFCDIESTTMYCQPEWFLNLNIQGLKRLYRNLEDLWNYRLQITNQIKSRISPPNGLVFTTSVSNINQYRNKYDLQNVILNEIMKFQNAITFEDKKMGYTYFMIGMVGVSRECYQTHSWLIV
jgi:hypothetical protein